MTSRPSFIFFTCFGLALCFGCKTDEGTSAGSANSKSTVAGPLYVVTTTGMIADTARAVAGTLAKVESLMQTGVDPHLYKASQSDVRRLTEADIIFYNGLHLEGKMGDILKKVGRRRPVVAVGEALDKADLRRPAEYSGAHDPHIWFDVSLWLKTVGPVVEALKRLQPANAAVFTANGEKWKTQLQALDSWVSAEIATIPEKRRVLVTAHDAFGYFGRRYKIEVVGLQGMSTVTQAGLNDVERVVDLIVKRRLKAIFVESSVPRRTIEAVQEACKKKGHTVAIGGQLFSDAMGRPGTVEGTYLGMVRHNVKTIVGALK